MDVHGIGSAQGSFPIERIQPAQHMSKPGETKPISTDDQVEISAAGRLLEEASVTSGIRAERLDAIRTAIEAGIYDTDEKLEAALEKLFHEIGVEERQ